MEEELYVDLSGSASEASTPADSDTEQGGVQLGNVPNQQQRLRSIEVVLSLLRGAMGNEASSNESSGQRIDRRNSLLRPRYLYRGQSLDEMCSPSALEYQNDHPPAPNNVACTDLGREILLRSGAKFAGTATCRLLRNRELGRCRGSDSSLKAHLTSTHALPNTSTVLAEDQSRYFIGRFSAHGEVYVTCCQRGLITLHDVTGRKITPFRTINGRNIGWSIVDFAFSPDEAFAVYSSWCDCLHMISVVKGVDQVHSQLDMRPEPDEHFCAFSLQFSGDNTQIMAGCNYGRIFIYDRMRGDRTLGFFAHKRDINSTCFGDDSSNILFSGSDDCCVRAWDRRSLSEESPRPVASFVGHSAGITCVDAKGDGRYLISNGKDHCMKLWDVRNPASQAGVEAAGQQPTRMRPFMILDPTRASHLDEHDHCVMSYRGHLVRSTLVRCHFSPLETTGQRYVYTGSAYGSCVIYDVLSGEVAAELDGHQAVVRDVSWHPKNPDFITTASWDGQVRLWERNVADEPMQEMPEAVPGWRSDDSDSY